MLMFDAVKLQKLLPTDFIQLVIDNIGLNPEEYTLGYATAKVSYIMGNFIALESRGGFYKSLFTVYLDIAKKMQNASLRNQLFDFAIAFGDSSSDEADQRGLEEMLKAGQVECANGNIHKFTKRQRYGIIRGIFKNATKTLEEKEEYLNAEMKIDYSDVDELRKLQC